MRPARQLWAALYCAFFTAVASALSPQDSVILTEYNRHSNASLLWGPYRSNLYVGIRPRLPLSLLTGLMWMNVDDLTGVKNMRHACDQNDDLAGFGWSQYDPRTGGRQKIHDNTFKIHLSTDFVKDESGNWGLRISGTPYPGYENIKTAMIFYAGLEGEGTLKLVTPAVEGAIPAKEDVVLAGQSPDLGPFKLIISEDGRCRHPVSSHPLEEELSATDTHHLTLRVPDGNVWQAKDIFLTMLKESVGELHQRYEGTEMAPASNVLLVKPVHSFSGNMHYVQKVFEGSFQYDVMFNAVNSGSEINSGVLGELVDTTLRRFEEKFAQVFTFEKPFDSEKYSKFGEDFLSNLIGGVGYFHGTALVDRSNENDFDDFDESELKQFQQASTHGQEEGPFELFTAVPSRPFFPRGFLWDEGFHLIPILEYDTDLALEILKSWFSLIDDSGWIAREQILGPEARSKVPEQFQVQYPFYANPPTLMLVFQSLLEKASAETAKRNSQMVNVNADSNAVQDMELGGLETGDGDELEMGTAHIKYPFLLFNYAREIYPKLVKHYEWFRRTQAGDLSDYEEIPHAGREAYRWRGRTSSHCFASGLDDYPRSEFPDESELHVDLLSWMGTMSRSMKEIAALLGYEKDVEYFAEKESAIIENIDALHWSEEHRAYCDVWINNYDEEEHVCHEGYVSLFPFLLKLLPNDNEHLLDVLKLIRDEEKLFSPFGVRSLSAKDPYYKTGENYWRGPIWVNMNYLILSALEHYIAGPDASKTPIEVKQFGNELYRELRVNLVENVYNQWKKTGYGYEQYNQDTGNGQGVRHFLGWTSLVVMIMKMPESLL